MNSGGFVVFGDSCVFVEVLRTDLMNKLILCVHVGEADDYCWSTRIKCSPGQRLQNAFILLPVDLSVVDRESLRLQIISETNGATLHQHTESSLFPSECGLRFDVTEHVGAKDRQETLCVKIITQEQSTLGSGLMCPPFLVTTWEKWSQG